MKAPKVLFNYRQEKDIENIIIGLETVSRGRQPDKEITEIIKHCGPRPSKIDIQEYLKHRWEGKEKILNFITSQLQEYWNTIEEDYFYHLTDRMQLMSFYNINNLTGFLSTRYGCGYKIDAEWFAVSVHHSTLRNALIAMHEIMHIFFHKQWWQFCADKGVPAKNIWDIKEAVTVLLNLWFKDVLVDIDLGYNEHTELRHLIKEWFLENRNFEKTLLKTCDYMKLHPEKSPNWSS
ncbi:MAG: hypothetical protein QME25_09420 [Bacteroidota bacterium]|nr:hypothetical protein [Bacteroidota bacterium]